MKKFFLTLASLLILASGCASSSQWTLTSGKLPFADPDPIIFEGGAVLSGWGVMVPYYAGTPELHFHVAPESVKDLPKDFNFTKFDWNFKLENPDKEFNEFLSKSSQYNKAEIVVNKITIPQEGHPLFYLVESPEQ
jgi:hypothetical protein